MSKTDAIRVIVGDGSRVDRDLVRFMLERDGFRVISSVAASEDLGRAASVMQPDAVVLGEELLDVGGGEAARLVREASPEAKIVLFSGIPAAAAAGPGSPDAVLERGIGLKDLTPTLGGLFKPLAVVGAAVATGTARPAVAAKGPAPATSPVPIEAASTQVEPGRRPLVVVTAAAAALILMIFVVARVLPVDRSAERSGATISPAVSGIGVGVAPGGPGSSSSDGLSPAAQDHLDAAVLALTALKKKIEEGDYFEITRLARRLLMERAAAQAAGADIGSLNEDITSTLRPALEGLSPFLTASLRGILGPLLLPDVALGSPSASPSKAPAGSNPTGGSGVAPAPPVVPIGGDGGGPPADNPDNPGGIRDKGDTGGNGGGSGLTDDSADVLGGDEDPSRDEGPDPSGDGTIDDCPKPGNGGGNGYGHCEGQGYGNDDQTRPHGQSGSDPAGHAPGGTAQNDGPAGWTNDDDEAEYEAEDEEDSEDESPESDDEDEAVSSDDDGSDHGSSEESQGSDD